MVEFSHTEYIFLCVLFYLIGSIPTAYLILKYRTGGDITRQGSGNVGALNSYEVTKSRSIGITVLILDFLKGFIPAFIFYDLLGFSVSFLILPLTFLLAGHNFSMWLKLKGGRGLATAAGISVAVNVWFLIIWGFSFLIGYSIKRNVHVGNITATLLLPVLVYILKDFINATYTTFAENFTEFFTLSIIISLLILLKHIKPFTELISKSK